MYVINPLNPELNPIYYLLALLGAHHFLHVSRIRVKLLTFRLLMSYINGAPILDVSSWPYLKIRLLQGDLKRQTIDSTHLRQFQILTL